LICKIVYNNQNKNLNNMKKLSFVLAALLITGVAFGEKKCSKKGTAGKACCKKEAKAEASAETPATTVTLNSAAAAPVAAGKGCCKKSTATKACCKKEAKVEAAAPAQAAPATR
jgi:hypothetical protein